MKLAMRCRLAARSRYSRSSYKKTPRIKIVGYGVLGVSLIALNVFFFSIPLLFTTVMVVAWYAYSNFKSGLSPSVQTSNEPPIENNASFGDTPVPPLITVVNHNTSQPVPQPLNNWRSNAATSRGESLARLGLHAPKCRQEEPASVDQEHRRGLSS